MKCRRQRRLLAYIQCRRSPVRWVQHRSTWCQCGVGGCQLDMEVDTGAVVSVASEKLYEEHWNRIRLQPTKLKLRDYQGGELQLKCVVMVPVQYGTQRVELPLVIVAGDRPALLGRNWLESIKLDWPSIRAVTVDTGVASVDDVVKQHIAVFKDGYGLIKDFKITIHLRPDTTPVFRHDRYHSHGAKWWLLNFTAWRRIVLSRRWSGQTGPPRQ